MSRYYTHVVNQLASVTTCLTFQHSRRQNCTLVSWKYWNSPCVVCLCMCDHCYSNSIHGSAVESSVIGTRLGLIRCISKHVRWTLLLPAEIHHSVLVCEAGMLIEVSDWAMIWKHHGKHGGRDRCRHYTCNQCEQEAVRAGQVVFKLLYLGILSLYY